MEYSLNKRDETLANSYNTTSFKISFGQINHFRSTFFESIHARFSESILSRALAHAILIPRNNRAGNLSNLLGSEFRIHRQA